MKQLQLIPAPGRAHFGALQKALAKRKPEEKNVLPFTWDLLELDRIRSVEAVAQVIRQVALVRPLALLLQGFHVASPVLLEFFRPVLTVAEELPLSLLLTMESCQQGDVVAVRLQTAVESSGVRFVPVELGPLDPVFLEESLGQRYPGAAFSEAVQQRLIGTASGNPGRLGEICLRLEEAGILFQQEGRWYFREDEVWPFPEQAEEYRLSPVLNLESEDFEVLEFLAGAGSAVPEGLLADEAVHRYLGVAERPCRKALGRLEQAGLIETVTGGWSFRDSALMQALRSESERSIQNRDLTVLAEAMARLPEQRPDVVAALLRRTGAEARAAKAYREAAKRFEEQGAWEAAGQAYRTARELDLAAGVVPILEESMDLHRREGNAWHVAGCLPEAEECYGAALVPAELLDLHGRAAGILCRRGGCFLDRGRFQEAQQDFQAALEAGEAISSLRAQRLAALGLVRSLRLLGLREEALKVRRRFPSAQSPVDLWLQLEEFLCSLGRPGEVEARQSLEEILARQETSSLARGRALERMAGELRRAGRDQEAMDLAGQAIGYAREVGDGSILARSLEVRASTAARIGAVLPEGYASLWTELARLAGRLGEDALQLVACMQAGETAVAEGDMGQAVRHLSRASQLASHGSQVAQEARAQNLLGIANLGLNKLYEAQSDFEAAGQLSLEVGDSLGHARSLLGLGRVYASQRKKERARTALSQARDAFLTLNLPGEAGQCASLLEELG
jgi:tetratricopeptide (TPR) repeat protein